MLFGQGGPSLEVHGVLHEKVRDAQTNNRYTSLASLCADVFAATSEVISRSTMHTWMHSLGFEHGEKKLSGLQAKYAHARVRRYLLDYSVLLDRERRGEIVLVWMDESYIHAGYCSRFGWYVKGGEGGVTANRVRGSEKGKRLIVIHAMTRDGMLAKENLDPSDNLDEACASAAIVTSKLSAEGVEPEDYHDTLDGVKFLQWMRNRLLPAFKAKYPRKKMVLILDNAKYHHARGEDWISPSTMRLAELGNFLRVAKVKSITLDDGTVLPAAKFTRDGRQGGPGVKKLREVVTDYVKSHPGINTTLVEQLMKEAKHELLYTPPYESWLQPIELVWARAKHAVARQANSDRKWQETQQQMIDALQGITPELCTSIISHTETLMDEWLKSDEAGSLKRHGSLDCLSRLSPQQRSQCSDLNLPDTLLTGAVEDEKENQDGMQE